MKLEPKFFIRDGNLTIAGAFLLVAFGFWLSYMSLEYLPFTLLKVIGLSIGLAVAAIGGFSGRAKSLELKPFTNDPLGWRKAKESYKENEAEAVLNQSADASAEDSKK